LLTAVGFGRIRIVDRDIVELSNIQRQTVFNTSDIGMPKAEAAAANLKLMNPEVSFDPICVSISDENAVDVLRGADIIVDGLDTFASRRAVNRASIALGIPYVFAGAVDHYANLTTFIPGKTGCLQCVMGDAQDNPENTCARVGVSPMLLSLAASVQVNEVFQLALGRNPALTNRLMTIDTASLSFDFFDIGKATDCNVCSDPVKYTPSGSNELRVTQLCSQSFNVAPEKMMNLDLASIADRLEKKKYSVKRMQRFLVVETPDNIKITIMPAGNLVIKGIASVDEATNLFQDILAE
jgi:adenylyltransferase/sulfurtransferase